MSKKLKSEVWEQINFLVNHAKHTVNELERYLVLKNTARDWHAVEDAASDIRDHEAKLVAYQEVLKALEQIEF